MPVTFKVDKQQARLVDPPSRTSGATPEDLLQECAMMHWQRSKEVLQSSVATSSLPTLKAKNNGFVDTVVEAYGQHHHLRIRPDDVWIAILTQLCFYVKKHAEDLREYFVAHEGKKDISVALNGFSRYTVDYGEMAKQMSQQLRDHVIDETLVDWILPNFTTTTNNDSIVCSVILMATLETYFDFKAYFICGIPTITLEGEKADWQKLYKRLDRLPELGEEPGKWAGMLRPILSRFVKAFDGQPDIPFWKQIVKVRTIGCGSKAISGWITAFCVWSPEGKWLPPDWQKLREASALGGFHFDYKESDCFTVDGISYFQLDIASVPRGFVDVDVKIDDNGHLLNCKMVAGHAAARLSNAAQDNSKIYDTLSPAPQWFIYVKGEQARDPRWQEMEDNMLRRVRR